MHDHADQHRNQYQRDLNLAPDRDERDPTPFGEVAGVPA
jgi:hypothetical protein